MSSGAAQVQQMCRAAFKAAFEPSGRTISVSAHTPDCAVHPQCGVRSDSQAGPECCDGLVEFHG